jgi:hypothetical protein
VLINLIKIQMKIATEMRKAIVWRFCLTQKSRKNLFNDLDERIGLYLEAYFEMIRKID